MRVVGLMSGTSLDGIDAALATFDGDLEDLHWSLDAFQSTPYPDAARRRIHDAILHGDAASLCGLHVFLGELLAAAVERVCASAGIDVRDVDIIGSHGQTVWHVPPSGARRGATLQLGCPATIAELTGVSVVSDFRARDMAAGGQGAPLVPFVDRALFALPAGVRVMQNIGGMANLTRVPARGSREQVIAFDTGPGNALMDAAVELATGGAETFDRGGARAAAGHIDETMLAELLAHPYYAAGPPKSTGREVFGRPYVEEIVARRPRSSGQDWNDLIATLTALTAHTIADAVRDWVLPRGADELVVTGGGARNPVLLRMLGETLSPLRVRSGEDIGIDVDAKEALAFAALAWAHVEGIPGNVPEATGASRPCVLGSYTPATRAGATQRRAARS